MSGVMAKGSFLVAQAAAGAMIFSRTRRSTFVYITSRTPSSPGPNSVAYSAAKADQAHQVRLLAAELGEHGIRSEWHQAQMVWCAAAGSSLAVGVHSNT